MNFSRLVLFGFLLAAAAGGYWIGKKRGDCFVESVSYPVTEVKPFVLIVYACNQADWCEKSLKSIFEQEYENYRVVLIDDASSDETFNRLRNFLVENNQEHRAILIRNEQREGFAKSLYRAVGNCRNREIAFPIDAKNWLSDPSVLTRLNQAYQNPDVWAVQGQAVAYPSYEKIDPQGPLSQDELDGRIPLSFYAGILKRISSDPEPGSRGEKKSDLIPLLQLAKGHWQNLSEPLAFSNSAYSEKLKCAGKGLKKTVVSFEPLSRLPED